ncbi:hypothetical protein HPP92_005557 [Vanilla planifolia]|uniref:Haloacid dehalogenase-like hydrolase family protein n=1 Tax=Vanilla planifolia TaxID=51239 RepID=A0A835V966_VANPL|nr:hypothetical protein HPP92_005557 [Vanilla planifolia]
MARIAARVFPLVSRYSPIPTSPAISSSLGWRPAEVPTSSTALSSGEQLLNFSFSAPRRGFHFSSSYSRHPGPFSSVFAALRGFRKARRRQAAMKQVPEEKKLELRVKISLEEGMPEDHEVLNIVEMLKLNAPMAMKMTFDGIKELDCRVQDSSIDNLGQHEKIDLSILLCNDVFISKLHKEWRGVDCPTDVLCRFQQKILGDIVISAEAAARQAKERGHSLLDEVRILLVQGLLHLLGFDQESDYRTSVEMGKLEELVLRSLGWKGRGHARDIDHVATSGFQSKDVNDKIINPRESLQDLRFYRPKFSYIFCDMDGTLLNSQSQVSITTAEALREVLARGVKIIIATGKTRPAVISALKMVGLAGKNGVASEVSPGIFLQGLLVYGRNGGEIHRRSLDQNVCREALFYSLEHEAPLVAFCQDRCLTLFDHPLVDSLHTVYHEPKAEVIPSVEHLLAAADIQP